MRAVVVLMLIGAVFATQAYTEVLCTNATGVGRLQVREKCNPQEVQTDPAVLGLDSDLAVYDSKGLRVGQVRAVLAWGTSSESRAVVAFQGESYTLVAIFGWSPSMQSLDLCLPQKRFCWKYK